jgi:hypothetical protein
LRPDWRADLLAWIEERRAAGVLTPQEEAVTRAWIAEYREPRPPTPEEVAEYRLRWAFLRRWPIEVRLGVLRVLRELDVMEALEKREPEVHAFLVDELQATRRLE